MERAPATIALPCASSAEQELEFDHPRQRARERRHFQQQVHERLERVGKFHVTRATDQIAGQPSVERRQHDRQLGGAALRAAKGDYRPEHGVGMDPDFRGMIDRGIELPRTTTARFLRAIRLRRRHRAR